MSNNSVNIPTLLSSIIAKMVLTINSTAIHFSLTINPLSTVGLEVLTEANYQEKVAQTPIALPDITLLNTKQLIGESEVFLQITTSAEMCQLFRQIAEHSASCEPTSSLSQTIDNNLATANIAFVYKARDLLLAHWQNPPSLKQLAHLVGTNPTKLSKVFQQTFGMTVFAYLREHRLGKAQCLLRQSHLSIQQIAETIGYQNPSDFTATFKQRFGLTPRQYCQTSNCDLNYRSKDYNHSFR